MPFCAECKIWLNDDQIYREDLSFDYAGTHCAPSGGIHREWGDLKSKCCDADVIDYNEDSDER